MDRRTRVELFEEIRRGYAAGETIKGLAKKHGVHRRMVRQAIARAIPPEKRKPAREAPKLDAVKEHIDRMLGDRQAPRKPRHTGSGRDFATSLPNTPWESQPSGDT